MVGTFTFKVNHMYAPIAVFWFFFQFVLCTRSFFLPFLFCSLLLCFLHKVVPLMFVVKLVSCYWILNSMEISLKTSNKTTIWCSSSTTKQAKMPGETKIEKDTCTSMFIAPLFTIARTWKQPRLSSRDEWIKQVWYIYTVKYCSVIKRNTFELVPMRWMNLVKWNK